MNDLPRGWRRATLGALGHWSSGGTPSRKKPEYFGGDIPWVKTGDLHHEPVKEIEETITDNGLKNSTARIFPRGSLLVAMYGATIGQTGILTCDAATNQACAALLANGYTVEIIPYVWRWLISKQGELKSIGQGGAQPNISQAILKQVTIDIAPLPEQRRIVAKIDSLSSKLKGAREQLDHVRHLVENYKQAVLTTAFSNATFIPRRLGDIVDEGPTNGYSPRASTDGLGTLSLKLTATTRGVFDLSEKAVKRIGETIEQGSRYWLEPGDLLIQRSNSLEYVGASAIYEGPRQTYIYPDLMMRVRIQNQDVRQFVWRFLSSREARTYFRANATGTAGNMPKINGATVRELLVPLPEPPQITAINKAIETAFDWIDRLAADASSARKLIDRLDEAILARAFRGELVPQDPNDEPADVLLERLRERQAATGEKAKCKKRRGVAPS